MATYPEAARNAALAAIVFDDKGLVPAIAQQHDSREVLMMAWMDRTAVDRTLATGLVHYYSRSRRRQWRKGEESGHTQTLVDFRIDCDGDTLLVLVEQTGVACHTGRRSCMFNALSDDGLVALGDIEIDPAKAYRK